jgi:predicted phage terminase large subunit-like protein
VINVNPIETFIIEFLAEYLKLPVSPVHREVLDALANRANKRIVIELARGMGKSTFASVMYILYEICEGNYEEIQTFSRSGGTAGLSTKWARKIRQELLENAPLIAEYGIQRGSSWGDDHFQVIRGDGHKVDVYCRGKKSSARGNRGLVVIDDLQNRDDVESEAVLERDEEWFFSDIIPILLKEQRLVFIGTALSPISLMTKVKQMKNYVVLEFPVDNPVGSFKSIWPDQYPDDFLRERFDEIGQDRFNAEYRCIPLVSGNPVWRLEWLESYEPDSVKFRNEKGRGLYIITGFDGAESKDRQADYTAIVTIGVTFDKKPNVYVLGARHERWTTKEGAEQLFVEFDQQKQNKSVVESRCKPPNVDAIIEEIQERQRIYHTYINLYQVKPDKDKVRRAMAVQSWFQQGRVFFDMTDPGQQQLISELTMFTGTQKFHDDMVDALVHAITEAKGWTPKASDQPTGFGTKTYGS